MLSISYAKLIEVFRFADLLYPMWIAEIILYIDFVWFFSLHSTSQYSTLKDSLYTSHMTLTKPTTNHLRWIFHTNNFLPSNYLLTFFSIYTIFHHQQRQKNKRNSRLMLNYYFFFAAPPEIWISTLHRFHTHTHTQRHNTTEHLIIL